MDRAIRFLVLLCLLISSSSPRKVSEEVQEVLMKLEQPHCDDDVIEAKMNTGIAFECEVSDEAKTPTSVHELRPEDIDVVGAIGDSFVAAFGADAKYIGPGAFKEYRGLSFAVGGDQTLEKHISIPNILKKYNPNVYGFSEGVGTENTNLNVAITGATSEHLEEMIDQLIYNIMTDPKIDMEEDWKLINIFIGGNDVFDSCLDKSITPEKFKTLVTSAFNTLRAMIPRALVNVMAIPDPTEIKKLTGVICDVAHMTVCPCLLAKDDEIKRMQDLRRDLNRLMQKAYAENPMQIGAVVFKTILEELVTSGEFDTDDFAMVFQPVTGGVYVGEKENGKTDYSFNAPDCIHLSKKGHASGAYYLWKNMIEPVNGKDTVWSPKMEDTLPCPKTPYFYTNRNSVTTNVAEQFSADQSSYQQPDIKSEHLSGGAITAIVFLVVCVAFVTGYLLYDKVYKYVKVRWSYQSI